jgi:transposase
MSKIDYLKAIRETVEELLQKEKEQSKAFVRDRIRFLRLLKSGRCSSQIQAGELIGLSARSSQRLWKQYREGGLKTLLNYPYRGTSCRLSEEQQEQLNCYLAEDQVQFLHEAKHYIEKQFGVRYSTSGLHKLFGRLKVKKKTGRPSNYRKEEKGASNFKKSSLLWQNPIGITISSSMKCIPAPARS